jgi:hypothetical protein
VRVERVKSRQASKIVKPPASWVQVVPFIAGFAEWDTRVTVQLSRVL